MLLITLALNVVACDRRPTLDFSSDEAAVISIQAVSEKLSLKDQQRFKAAMGKIVTSITNETFSKTANMADAYPMIKNRIHKTLNGKTAEDIIALAEKI